MRDRSHARRGDSAELDPRIPRRSPGSDGGSPASPTLRLVAVLCAATLAVTAAACASGPPGPEVVREHMFNSMWHMGSIPGRLIVGDVNGVRSTARWLGGQIEADPTFGAGARRDRMIALAAAMETATAVPEAARAVADLAVACGSCHAEDSGPSFGELSPMPVGSRLPTHMLRHQWAADRLWEGLIAAESGHWNAGAGVLTEEPLPFFERLRDVPDARRYARRLHQLGDEALVVDDPAERAGIYAELLTTCAGCHAAMDVPR